MVLLVEECARILDCKVKSLRDRLNHPIDRTKILNELAGKKVRTTYLDRNGMHKTFFVDGLTHSSAAFLQAYGKLPRPFNCSVVSHYYCRHKIRLQFPYHPCIIENMKKGENRFYPLELLELVDENKRKWPVKFYLDEHSSSSTETLTTIDENYEEIDFQSGRDQCSQAKDDLWWLTNRFNHAHLSHFTIPFF